MSDLSITRDCEAVADKLELLAIWFDKRDDLEGVSNSTKKREVQADLRRWAGELRNLRNLRK